MAVKVIDASALAALVFDEPDADTVVAAMGRSSLVAPQWIEVEVANVCLKKIRAYPLQRHLYLAALQLAERLRVQTAHVELAEVITLAEDARLSVYDACYLWLARTLDCELLTLDKRLAAASKRRA